jgi:hypothetical protein
MHLSTRGAAAIAAAIVTLTTASLFAQAGAGVGSLGELTAEIRLLRAAIEQSSRTQTQAQALGVYLSAQQSRILHVTARLDAARKELDAIAREATAHSNEAAALEAHLTRTNDPNERAAVEERASQLKLQSKVMTSREQEARMREAEILQAWQQEEANWNNLIARLQQVVQP